MAVVGRAVGRYESPRCGSMSGNIPYRTGMQQFLSPNCCVQGVREVPRWLYGHLCGTIVLCRLPWSDRGYSQGHLCGTLVPCRSPWCD